MSEHPVDQLGMRKEDRWVILGCLIWLGAMFLVCLLGRAAMLLWGKEEEEVREV